MLTRVIRLPGLTVWISGVILRPITVLLWAILRWWLHRGVRWHTASCPSPGIVGGRSLTRLIWVLFVHSIIKRRARGNGLFDDPGVACQKQFPQGREAFTGFHLLDLTAYLLVIDGSLYIADDTDGYRQLVAIHHRELLVEEV